MTDEAAMIATTKADPRAVTPRLVYADWLDDHDRPGEAALLRVLAEPEKDEHRLAYADWLADHGQEERAAFIRASVGKAREQPSIKKGTVLGRDGLPYWPGHNDPPKGVATADSPNPRFDELCRKTNGLWTSGLRESVLTDVGLDPSGEAYVNMERGFIDHLFGVSGTDWLRLADRILAAHPVRRVRLTTLPGVNTRFSARLPYSADFWFAGREKTVMLSEPDFVRLMEPGQRPGEGKAVRREAASRLLALEWPGVEFELPPSEADEMRREYRELVGRPFRDAVGEVDRLIAEGRLHPSARQHAIDTAARIVGFPPA